MTLSEDDKRRIQEEERYRAEVRAKTEKPKGMGCGGGCLGIILIAALFILYVARTSSPTPSSSSLFSSSAPFVATRSPAEIQEAIADEKRRLGLLWQYQDTDDQMGRGKVRYAVINSTNEFEFGFPYAGKQRATLTLRMHPKHGKDVILNIERGQFLCPLDNCNVAVKFDQQKPKNFSASGPADHSTTVLFISGFSTFVSGLKTAKALLIEAPMYQEGNKIYEFEVAGFEWPALQSKRTTK